MMSSHSFDSYAIGQRLFWLSKSFHIKEVIVVDSVFRVSDGRCSYDIRYVDRSHIITYVERPCDESGIAHSALFMRMEDAENTKAKTLRSWKEKYHFFLIHETFRTDGAPYNWLRDVMGETSELGDDPLEWDTTCRWMALSGEEQAPGVFKLGGCMFFFFRDAADATLFKLQFADILCFSPT